MDKSLAYAEGQLVVAGDRLCLVRGKRTLFTISLAEIRALQVEEAKSFQHPWLGLAFAAVLLLFALAASAIVLVSDPRRFSIKLAGAALFCLVLGVAMVWDVLRSPRICWLRVRSRKGRQRLALPGANPQEVEELVQDLRSANGSIL